MLRADGPRQDFFPQEAILRRNLLWICVILASLVVGLLLHEHGASGAREAIQHYRGRFVFLAASDTLRRDQL